MSYHLYVFLAYTRIIYILSTVLTYLGIFIFFSFKYKCMLVKKMLVHIKYFILNK